MRELVRVERATSAELRTGTLNGGQVSLCEALQFVQDDHAWGKIRGLCEKELSFSTHYLLFVGRRCRVVTICAPGPAQRDCISG
jgi:hypothetical protein